MKKTVLITAGGTGGHIFPGLAVAHEIKNDYNVVWVGATLGVENTIVPQHGIKLETVKISGLRNKGLLVLIKTPLSLVRAIFKSIKLILQYRPDVVISFGGYASFPVAITARLLRIPLIIHEQNSVPGLTNRILAKIANKILVAFNGVLASHKTILVGNPIRQDILKVYDLSERYSSRTGGLNILVVGGSLGASFFNENLPEVFSKLSNINHITHQVGKGDSQLVIEHYAKLKLNARVVNFIENMAEAYNNVDLVICRSGALTVSEICAIGLAAIFIPYPYAVDNHQETNAQPLVDIGASKMMLQKDFSVDKMVTIIANLDRDTCYKMALTTKSLGITDSHLKIASVIRESVS